MGKIKLRRDSKHRVLRRGESIRPNGKYQFKYMVGGKARFVYSWKLVPTDPQPVGTMPDLSLREKEKLIGRDLESQLDPVNKSMTVKELTDRYLKTKVGVRPGTKANYKYVQNLMEKEEFNYLKIGRVKTSDAKLFLVKLQNDGKGHSTIKSVRGVLRPAFQMAVDDDILNKNPFGFELANVVVNDSVTREAISLDQMRKFLRLIKDDNVYCKYYEAVYILFHTGLRISEFCGLTLSDLDMQNRIINVDHQLQRDSHMNFYVDAIKTSAGTRMLPMTDEVYECFKTIIAERGRPKQEVMIDGHTGFLYLNEDGTPQVAMHWQHRFKHMVNRYNEIYRVQLPSITPHVCRHTYCSNMARSGMNPKTLQYLMGHSDIGVTMNTYTHLGLEDAAEELKRLEGLRKAQVEMGRLEEKEKPVSRNMFKAI